MTSGWESSYFVISEFQNQTKLSARSKIILHKITHIIIEIKKMKLYKISRRVGTVSSWTDFFEKMKKGWKML